MKVGALVKGKQGRYGIINEKMTKAVVLNVIGENIKIKILEHEANEKGVFDVESKYFEVIGELKKFNRKEVLKLLEKGCKKEVLEYFLSGANLSGTDLRGVDLRGADLRGANLSGADLDFSCYPLWCGGLKIKTDKKIACQFAYHLCSMQCEDDEYIKMRNSILEFANQFHRVSECGKLEEINGKSVDV